VKRPSAPGEPNTSSVEQRWPIADALLLECVTRIGDRAGHSNLAASVSLSMLTTRAWVSRNQYRTTAEPMKPAPPVTKTVEPLNRVRSVPA